MKLLLISDSSEAVAMHARDAAIAEWGLEHGTRNIEKIAEAGAINLFGEAPLSLLSIDGASELKQVVSDLEKLDSNSSKLAHGLIITTDVGGNQIKKLQNLVVKLGGEAKVVTKSKSVDTAPDLVASLNVSAKIKDFLVDWAGQEPGQLVSLVRAIEAIPPSRQAQLTMDDIMIRLPLPPGSIAPWDIEKPLLAGNVDETISTYRRIVSHSAPILVQFVLYGKFSTMHKVAAIVENDPSITNDQINEILGLKGRQIYFLRPTAKRFGAAKLEKCVDILAKTEDALKSGAADANLTYEVAILKILLTLR